MNAEMAARLLEACRLAGDRQSKMKRPRESEDDDPDGIPESSRVRDVLYSQDRPSGSMDDPISEFNHQIFLSHSGFQKDLVDELCGDLEKCNYVPFFDRRPSSLPKGERFPELILEAARKCQMGVVVVSDEYFMSKWPMMELNAFVQTWLMQKEQESNTMLKILPLFYGLSVEEFDKEERRATWFNRWEELANEDARIDMNEWKESLKVLASFNGIQYHPGSKGVKAYREEIVKQICNEVPPDVKWDDSHVQGGARFCQVIQNAISQVQPSEQYGICVVGVYGVGGIGKTTLCKILCNTFFQEYHGKVTHVELGSQSSRELLKEVIKDLINTNLELLKGFDEGKCWNILRKDVCKQKAFLTIDNVWLNSKSIEEARKYLQLHFHKESVVIVTSRALETLTSLGICKCDCFPMSSLEDEDAKNLFLYHAGYGTQSPNNDDKWAIERCVEFCNFGKGHNNDRHYLPLALKALGMQVGCIGNSPSEWVKALPKVKDFNYLQDEENPVFNILRSSFDCLRQTEQNLFMDLILFDPNSYYHNDHKRLGLMEWLALIYNQSLEEVENRVQQLKKRGLVEDVDMTAQTVYMHDLYREFAQLEAGGKLTDSDFEKRKWVYYKNTYPTELIEVMPSHRRWQNLIRLSIEELNIQSLQGIEWTNCSNIVVLKLTGLWELRGDLDLKGLNCLKSLEFVDISKLDTLDGLQDLKNLTYFKWGHSEYSYDVRTRMGQLPASLKVLLLDLGVSLRSEVFDRCVNLTKMDLSYCYAKNLDFRKCTSLQSLELIDLGPLEAESEWSLDGLQDLSNLTYFRWTREDPDGPDWGTRIGQLPASLKVVEIDESLLLRPDVFARCTKLSKLSLGACLAVNLDFSNCTSLQSFSLREVERLNTVSGLSSASTSLQSLEVFGCHDLVGIPGLGQLVGLERLCLQYLRDNWNLRLSDLSCLTNLTELHLEGSNVELREEDVCMLASLPRLHPVVLGHGRYSVGSSLRLDVKRRKVLKSHHESYPGDSWLGWSKWEERDLIMLPTSVAMLCEC